MKDRTILSAALALALGAAASGAFASFGNARIAADDGALLGRVVSALQSDPGLRGAELQVEIVGGVVGITGHAADAAQAQRAGRVAAEAAGGARVETDIDVQ